MEIIARLAADETPGDRIIKVNHAAEHGAVNFIGHSYSPAGGANPI
jgi:hypothetical protein